MTDFIWRLR